MGEVIKKFELNPWYPQFGINFPNRESREWTNGNTLNRWKLRPVADDDGGGSVMMGMIDFNASLMHCKLERSYFAECLRNIFQTGL